MKVNSAEFIISNTDYRKAPSDRLPEYAFIGRSNVGKSSLINMLTGRKQLAKISGKPGKTQLINHFLINRQWYLVDLPGYGWAKVSKSLRAGWEPMIANYITQRENLCCVFVLIDSRIEPQTIDMEFLFWAGQEGIPITILMTKIDKQSKSKTSSNLARLKKELYKSWEELPPILLTSSVTGEGREEVLDIHRSSEFNF